MEGMNQGGRRGVDLDQRGVRESEAKAVQQRAAEHQMRPYRSRRQPAAQRQVQQEAGRSGDRHAHRHDANGEMSRRPIFAAA